MNFPNNATTRLPTALRVGGSVNPNAPIGGVCISG